jgi:hypothetical protein
MPPQTRARFTRVPMRRYCGTIGVFLLGGIGWLVRILRKNGFKAPIIISAWPI